MSAELPSECALLEAYCCSNSPAKRHRRALEVSNTLATKHELRFRVGGAEENIQQRAATSHATGVHAPQSFTFAYQAGLARRGTSRKSSCDIVGAPLVTA
jgi:hypothetical protein